MSSKHGRDQTQDFQGLLNDLQDWELSLKDKKFKHQPPANLSNTSGDKFKPSGSGKYDLSSSFVDEEESELDANSEKEQGNEFFKKRKFNEAIDCYSRSIALSPNAVAYANRAMAYLKIKRYREAEVDCTEALNLDDRYIKAYSRRATARKELGMLKEAKEDAEFALRLEPQSQELEKQYADVKSLLEKEIIEKATGAMQSTAQDLLKTAGLDKNTKTPNTEFNLKPATLGAKTNEGMIQPVSGSEESSGKKLIENVQPEEKKKQDSKKIPAITEHVDSKKVTPKSEDKELRSSDRDSTEPSGSVSIDKDKKIKQQPTNFSNPNGDKFKLSGSRKYDLSSSFVNDDESELDANSEKEQGNEFFKKRKFNEAIDCYSRSIALSPNVVAYANRAMAYLKIKRYREAEVDCTEALNLDDRYIKAYSRRATARKELGMLKEAKEDAELALRLEPQSQELKKQYADVKSLLEKEIIEKATGAMQSTAQELLKTAGLDKKTKAPNTENFLKPVTLGAKTNGDLVQPVSGSKDSLGKKLIENVQPELQEQNKEVSKKIPAITEHVGSKKVTPRSVDKESRSSDRNSTEPSGSGTQVSRKEELKPSVQDLATRAASLAMAEVSKNITAPKSAYEFENLWRSFSGDSALQTQLLKVMDPSSLPQIFKNALTSPVLVDIIKCVASFFAEDMDLAVQYIENLTKVPRFNMLVMCLTSTEKNELRKLWSDVFCNKATPTERAEVLDKLRSTYCLK